MSEKKQPESEPMNLEQAGGAEGSTEEGIDIDALVTELERLDIKEPEKLQGIHAASQQAGNLANIVGSLREENRQMKEMLEGLSTRQSTHDEGYGETVDLSSALRKELRTFWSEDIIKPQQEAYSQQMREMAAIQGDEDYPFVQEKWNEYASNPMVIQQINSGQTTYLNEYNKLVRRYFRGVAQQARQGLEQLRSGGAPAAKPAAPHMERGTGAAPPEIPADPDKSERISKATETWEGKDGDLDRLLEAVLPDGDPLMRYED